MMAPAVEIVTLENFRALMPQWNPDQKNHLYALVDMGSNGIRFSISDLSPPTSRLLKCVYRERAAISLFDALNASAQQHGDQQLQQPLTFPPETIALTAQTLARFWRIALDDFGVPPAQFTVFATEAMRRAANAADMLDAISSAAIASQSPGAGPANPPPRVFVLAPPVETLFGSLGARSGFNGVRGLFLDLGGGSVQMTYMDTFAANAAAASATVAGSDKARDYPIAAALAGESLPFGAAKLISILNGADAQAQADAKSTLAAGMRRAFDALRAKFQSLAETVAVPAAMERAGIDIYLCGGGFRGYGSMLQHTEPLQPYYPIPSIAGYSVPGARFGDTEAMLRANVEAEGKIFGMSKRRRQQFPAIVTVVEALVAAVQASCRIRMVTFCGGGNREGALMMMLPPALRESNPLPLIDRLAVGSASREEDTAVLQTILDCIGRAIPRVAPGAQDKTTPPLMANLFPPGLEVTVAQQIWARSGEDPDANAAWALHDAVGRDPSCPGLTHVARAMLGLAACARWGGNLARADRALREGLRGLVSSQLTPGAVFFADYIGTIAAVMAKLVPARPRTRDAMARLIRFEASYDDQSKKEKLALKIFIAPRSMQDVDLQGIEGLFKDLKPAHDVHGRIKIAVSFQELT